MRKFRRWLVLFGPAVRDGACGGKRIVYPRAGIVRDMECFPADAGKKSSSEYSSPDRTDRPEGKSCSPLR